MHQLSACIFCKWCLLTLVHGLPDIKAHAVLAHRWWFHAPQRCHPCMTTAASQPQLGNKMKLKIKDGIRKEKCKHFDGCNSSERTTKSYPVASAVTNDRVATCRDFCSTALSVHGCKHATSKWDCHYQCTGDLSSQQLAV